MTKPCPHPRRAESKVFAGLLAALARHVRCALGPPSRAHVSGDDRGTAHVLAPAAGIALIGTGGLPFARGPRARRHQTLGELTALGQVGRRQPGRILLDPGPVPGRLVSQQGVEPVAGWDESVGEKPESRKVEGLCPVRSAKGKRLQYSGARRAGKGGYGRPQGRPAWSPAITGSPYCSPGSIQIAARLPSR